MKRITVAGACVIAVVAIGSAIVSAFSGQSGVYGLVPASSALATTTPVSASSLLALETAALTRQGISPARAGQAIRVQGEIAQAGLASKIEAAMASTYAGMWFEPATAQLHIGVTSPASRHTAERVVARTGLTANVTETPVRSTWAQLLAMQKQWNRRLANLFAREEAQTAIAPQSNSVAVSLGSLVSSPERAAIKQAASTANANIEVNVVSSPKLNIELESTPTTCNKFAREEAYCNKTITSGVTIQSETGVACTAGPMAIPRASKNETYLLTAGHCVTKGGIGSKWFAFNQAGTKQAIGPVAEFVRSTKADIGAIQIANPGYWVETKDDDPVYADTSEWSTKNPETSYPVEGERQPMVGNTDCHEGQTTGQSCGVITKLNAEGGNLSTVGLVEVGGTIGEAGDSGGPWLFIQTKMGNPALMEGTLVGFSRTNNNLVFEPLTKAYSELKGLNLELLTTANEVRSK
jgi:streptogrisin C